uniref:Glycoside hydrolase family 5 n=1 Tax=uncultured bacterium contig00061 TaxID=1181544 RepID=A0A806JZM9_9BACT|nr:glycoside hydrolase family 5 [uncultured bacterium contig00061]
MKKLTITCTLMLLFAVLFSACNNVFEPGEIPGLIKDGYGQVTINIEGVNARTTYPAAVFDDVEYTFTQGGVSKEPVSNNGTTYTLETGANWVVTVKGYKTVGTVKTLVAQGSSSSFSIATGSNPAVSVKLSIVDAVSTQNGTLTIAITKPNDATMTLLLEDMFSSDTPDIVNGENTIAAGIYLLTVNLELPGGETKYAGTGEIVYIYPHMTTSFSRTFAEADFSVWQAFRDITAAQLVSEIKIGWNLGNTFEAAHMTWLGENPTVTQMETGWGNPVTTKANIDALKTAGFNAIRIPVTWIKAADSNYNIRTDWMARITEVVNYAVANDMYIFLNTHHDEEDVYDFSDEGVEASLSVYKKSGSRLPIISSITTKN